MKQLDIQYQQNQNRLAGLQNYLREVLTVDDKKLQQIAEKRARLSAIPPRQLEMLRHYFQEQEAFLNIIDQKLLVALNNGDTESVR
mgnify:CR=1 FL=1